MNLVVLKGNLTKDIELKYTPNGTALAKTSIAISDGYGDNKKTYFFNLTFFGKTAEMVNQYLHKGSSILVRGKLVQETWTDNMGNKKQNVSVIVENVEFCEKKASQTNQPQQTYNQTPPQQNNNIDEESIPF